MNYSTLIKALRESMILSQEEFANYLGVSFAIVNHWEKRSSRTHFQRETKAPQSVQEVSR